MSMEHHFGIVWLFGKLDEVRKENWKWTCRCPDSSEGSTYPHTQVRCGLRDVLLFLWRTEGVPVWRAFLVRWMVFIRVCAVWCLAHWMSLMPHTGQIQAVRCHWTAVSIGEGWPCICRRGYYWLSSIMRVCVMIWIGCSPFFLSPPFVKSSYSDESNPPESIAVIHLQLLQVVPVLSLIYCLFVANNWKCWR